MRPTLRFALVAIALSLAAEASAAPKKTGTVTINCPVVGASVTIDGEEIGTLPLDPFELKFGNHTVRVVRSGLIAFQEQFTLRPGEEHVVTALPKEAKSLLSIAVSLRGGDVLLDGKSIGQLPVEELPIAPGQHVLAIKKDGLQTYTEKFNVGPSREFVSKPVLRNKDGSIVQAAAFNDAAQAKGGLGLDLDLDTNVVAKNGKGGKNAKGGKAPAGGLGLDLGLDDPPLPVAKNDAKAKSDDLDLDLDLGLPGAQPAAGKPTGTTVAANTKPAPIGPATTAKPATPIGQKQQPTAIAANTKPATKTGVQQPAAATFTADPIAADEVDEDEEPGEPLYLRKWVWGTAAAAVVVGVAIPFVTGKTGGYREVRNPTAACADCLVVLNK